MDIDANTPDFGTPISEWMRLVDISADGQTIHEVHNVLACLVANRYDAGLQGWNPVLLLNDIHFERRLRQIIRGLHGAKKEAPRNNSGVPISQDGNDFVRRPV